jgi:osmotically-inducible protein OsmY
MPGLLTGGAIGAAAAYFLDPDNGARRRNVARDWTMARLRRGADEVQRKAQYAQGVATGVAHRVKDPTSAIEDGAQINDATLARKVESIIFRAPDAPKGKVSVNVEDGVVYLRGELESRDEIDELVKAANGVDGVRRVENLLHLPAEPAPSRQ